MGQILPPALEHQARLRAIQPNHQDAPRCSRHVLVTPLRSSRLSHSCQSGGTCEPRRIDCWEKPSQHLRRLASTRLTGSVHARTSRQPGHPVPYRRVLAQTSRGAERQGRRTAGSKEVARMGKHIGDTALSPTCDPKYRGSRSRSGAIRVEKLLRSSDQAGWTTWESRRYQKSEGSRYVPTVFNSR
jgi:hypothetical protein